MGRVPAAFLDLCLKDKMYCNIYRANRSSCKDMVRRREFDCASQMSHSQTHFLHHPCSFLCPYHLVTPFAKCRCQSWVQILTNGPVNALHRGDVPFRPFLLPVWVLSVHTLSPSYGITP